MVVRELKDGRAIVATQEDHAELSAQFAAHWGNERFSQLRPYSTMVFATTYHDSGYREFERVILRSTSPKDGPTPIARMCLTLRPRSSPPTAKTSSGWDPHDPYAALLVSMHRTGLWHNRYNVFTEPAGRLRERSPEVQAAKKDLEAKQEKAKLALAVKNAGFENELAYNYRALQIYDLLSLYCCDGYAAEDTFREYKIAPVRVTYDSKNEQLLSCGSFPTVMG